MYVSAFFFSACLILQWVEAILKQMFDFDEIVVSPILSFWNTMNTPRDRAYDVIF